MGGLEEGRLGFAAGATALGAAAAAAAGVAAEAAAVSREYQPLALKDGGADAAFMIEALSAIIQGLAGQPGLRQVSLQMFTVGGHGQW